MKKVHTSLLVILVLCLTITTVSKAQQVKIPYSANVYFNQLSLSERLTKVNLLKLMSPNADIKSDLVKFINNHQIEIDSIFDKHGLVRDYLSQLLIDQRINARLWTDTTKLLSLKSSPDWAKIKSEIAGEFPTKVTNRAIILAKLNWYEFKNDQVSLAKYHVENIEKFGMDTVGIGKVIFNNIMYEIVFRYNSDKADLIKSSRWMKLLIDRNPPVPEQLDTYANLLYKAGEIKNAIIWEQKAVNLANQNPGMKKELESTLYKMMNSEKTW